MKLVIGLGNSGKKFLRNRHNAGHLFIDFLRSQELLLRSRFLKTNVFMNDSGVFVKKAASRQQIAVSDLYIAHDDLDLPLGKYKIQLGKGPELHYGIQSIENELGTKDFWRIRIGIDSRQKDSRLAGEQFVLQDFTPEELEILKGVFDAITKDHSFPS